MDKDTIIDILEKHGPSRSSEIASVLEKQLGISNVNARQKLSRVGLPVKKISILPKTEVFLYLNKQKDSDIFTRKLDKALRDTNSAYGIALTAMQNRGGIVEIAEFGVISGAPIPDPDIPTTRSKQIDSNTVAEELLKWNLMSEKEHAGSKFYLLEDGEEIEVKWRKYKNYSLIEKIILIHLRYWIGKINLASYERIAIRGEIEKKNVRDFMFDLTAPSYIFPFKQEKRSGKAKKALSGKDSFGFLVADVFAGGITSEKHLDFFLRKINSLKSTHVEHRLLPLLIASNFGKEAFNKARSFGIIATTPRELFGENVAKALEELLDLLQSVVLKTDSNIEDLISFLGNLSNKIEGTGINLKGDLFELICLYLAKTRAESVEHSVVAIAEIDDEPRKAEIDILRRVDESECVAIECKSRPANFEIGKDEIEKWLKKLPIIKSYLCVEKGYEGNEISFEFWTTAKFSKDALALLEKEKAKRTKNPIDWKQMDDIIALAKRRKATRIVEMLKNQFPDR